MTALLPDATHSKEALKGRLLFLRSFLNDPRQVGSLSPSLHFLGDTMREMIEEVSRGPFTVAVLGVGTGAVAKSFSGLDLYGFDLSAPLLSYARERLPDAELRRADVLSRDFSLKGLPKDKPIAIVSCIPVVNLTARQRCTYEEKIDAFLDTPQVFCFLQYSYLPRPPLRIPRSSRRQRWVLRNLPPAGIHLWRRSSPASGVVAKAA